MEVGQTEFQMQSLQPEKQEQGRPLKYLIHYTCIFTSNLGSIHYTCLLASKVVFITHAYSLPR